MNGIQLMQLGKNCAAAQTNIPLNLIPTAPRMIWKDGWIAEYWYFFYSVEDHAIYAPQYYMALRVLGGWPEEMRRLHGNETCLGDSEELFDPKFRAGQMAYLNRCADMITQAKPNQKQLNDLAEEWLRTLSSPLRAWFTKQETPKQTATGQNADAEPEAQPRDLLEYWENEMSDAIRAGDYERAEMAQKEMRKAQKRKQR